MCVYGMYRVPYITCVRHVTGVLCLLCLFRWYIDPAENVMTYHNFVTGERIFDYQMRDKKLREICIENMYGKRGLSIIMLYSCCLHSIYTCLCVHQARLTTRRCWRCRPRRWQSGTPSSRTTWHLACSTCSAAGRVTSGARSPCSSS